MDGDWTVARKATKRPPSAAHADVGYGTAGRCFCPLLTVEALHSVMLAQLIRPRKEALANAQVVQRVVVSALARLCAGRADAVPQARQRYPPST